MTTYEEAAAAPARGESRMDRARRVIGSDLGVVKQRLAQARDRLTHPNGVERRFAYVELAELTRQRDILEWRLQRMAGQ